jgi:hypothetical protein
VVSVSTYASHPDREVVAATFGIFPQLRKGRPGEVLPVQPEMPWRQGDMNG